jgi:hypothetical protein
MWVWLIVLLVVTLGVWSMARMPSHSFVGALPPMTVEEKVLCGRLKSHVGMLAGTIGERNLWRAHALHAAAGYIEKTLHEIGYTVAVQDYGIGDITLRNIAAELTGRVRPQEIVLLGAHYDSVRSSPGANDNASGTAALLELARLLAGQGLTRSVRFMAFVNEEPPFFFTDDMGSRRYARRARRHGEHIVAMLSLETLGCYADTKGSQQYPLFLHWLYPETGNFLAFVGSLSSRPLVRTCLASFRRHTRFPSEGIAGPGWMRGVLWSDHWSFWKEGYPAIMVTDTAFFRYAYYHTKQDTPEQVDYERLARVVAGLARVTEDLAGGRPQTAGVRREGN